MAVHPHLLRAMAAVENAQLSLSEDLANGHGRIAKRPSVFESMDAIPFIAGDAQVVLVSADYKKLMRSLKRKERLDQIPEEQVALVLLREKDEIRVIQLNRTTYELMRLCNGSRTITEIAGEFKSIGLAGVSPLKASMYGLASLAQKGFIDIRSAAN